MVDSILNNSIGFQTDIAQQKVTASEDISPEKVTGVNSDDRENDNKSEDTVKDDTAAYLTISPEGKDAQDNGGLVKFSDDNGKVVAKDDDMVDSLVGLSKSQVELLYREGRVSYNDYETNMEEREQLQESMNGSSDEDAATLQASNEEVQEVYSALAEDAVALNSGAMTLEQMGLPTLDGTQTID